ncbi:hypothetical protein QNH47_06215 [Virgibacillus halodenitrificans]|uniref:hypothetical protein n=1 Tax=Virgibacillus halodenitrificans TaxID=1482 RepID=UPI0024C01E94|nr:hypothetical protein [Virgibacillus halodenitrificans]WHX27447.1 hypothetical protein QNH47_06215 [Virgibacillus halodenitrificans]
MSEGKVFTQAEVDEIVERRLARERKKQEGAESTESQAEAFDTPNYKKSYEENLRKVELLNAGFSLDDLPRYEKYLTATTPAEIKRQAVDLAQDIKRVTQKGKGYADPSQRRGKQVWNPFN